MRASRSVPTQAIQMIFPERMLHNRTVVVELLGKVDG